MLFDGVLKLIDGCWNAMHPVTVGAVAQRVVGLTCGMFWRGGDTGG